MIIRKDVKILILVYEYITIEARRRCNGDLNKVCLEDFHSDFNKDIENADIVLLGAKIVLKNNFLDYKK